MTPKGVASHFHPICITVDITVTDIAWGKFPDHKMESGKLLSSWTAKCKTANSYHKLIHSYYNTKLS